MPFSRADAMRSSMDTASRRICGKSGSPRRTITTGVPWVRGRRRDERALTREMPMVSSANTLTASTPDVTE